MTAVFQCDTVDLDKESCIDHVQQARVLKVFQSLSQIITEGHLIGCCSSIGKIVSSMLLPKCRIPPGQNSLMSWYWLCQPNLLTCIIQTPLNEKTTKIDFRKFFGKYMWTMHRFPIFSAPLGRMVILRHLGLLRHSCASCLGTLQAPGEMDDRSLPSRGPWSASLWSRFGHM